MQTTRSESGTQNLPSPKGIIDDTLGRERRSASTPVLPICAGLKTLTASQRRELRNQGASTSDTRIRSKTWPSTK